MVEFRTDATSDNGGADNLKQSFGKGKKLENNPVHMYSVELRI